MSKPWRYVSGFQARVERAERSKDTGFVYFVACGPYIKIGHSLDHPRDRVRTMATGNPFPCRLVGMLAAGRDHERDIQKRFAALRHIREWFYAGPELLAYIAEACGDWAAIDRLKRDRASVAERIARGMGDNRKYWHDKAMPWK